MSYSTIDYYLIRAPSGTRKERRSAFRTLETLLADEAVSVKHRIKRICAVAAEVYDHAAVDRMREQGYEVIAQEKNFGVLRNG
jgi:hypothetical protein